MNNLSVFSRVMSLLSWTLFGRDSLCPGNYSVKARKFWFHGAWCIFHWKLQPHRKELGFCLDCNEISIYYALWIKIISTLKTVFYFVSYTYMKLRARCTQMCALLMLLMCFHTLLGRIGFAVDSVANWTISIWWWWKMTQLIREQTQTHGIIMERWVRWHR